MSGEDKYEIWGDISWQIPLNLTKMDSKICINFKCDQNNINIRSKLLRNNNQFYQMSHQMPHKNGIHVGVYTVQYGFRNNTALIHSPYLKSKVQVCNALSMNILDGAQVYWQQSEKFKVFKKNKNTVENVITAKIVNLKHCKYVHEGINIICTLSLDFSGHYPMVLARPLNKKLPLLEIYDIYGYPANYQNSFLQWENMTNYYYWVRIQCWNQYEKYPKAYVTGIFNKVKSAESETQSILYSLNVEQRQAFLNYQTNKLSSQKLPIRDHQDFEEMVFTIDPEQSIDMEDALSLNEIGNGRYSIGIHIADVSSFLHLVDRKQISQRGSSIYLPHKTIHMFPQEITQLCSFQEGKNRLAFSVIFIMNEEGQIESTTFKKTIVKNTAKMNYAEAQQIIYQEDLGTEVFEKRHNVTKGEAQVLFKKLRILKKIAFNRRKIRKSRQILDRNQVTFELDEQNLPIAVGIKKRFDSERLVEEFMIAANGEVARKIVQDYGQKALIIHHPKPSQYSINNLNSFVSDFGVQFKTDCIMTFESQMKKLIEKEGIKDQFKQALRMKAIQIQQLATYALYSNSQKGHYGLNMEYYTHFTSPLRRFADIIVHQQLSHCLHKDKKQQKDSGLDKEIQLINKARGRNKKMKQMMVQCFLNLYLFQKKTKIQAKALVMSLGLRSATLYIPLYNLVKEISWQKSVKSSGKQCVKVSSPPGDDQQYFISKNDSIDVEIEADVHQQVKVTMYLKDNFGYPFQI